MRFPEWAIADSNNRLKFICQLLASYSGPNGLVSLSETSGVSLATIHSSLKRGRFTGRTALALTSTSRSEIPFHWLVAPDEIMFDVRGCAE